MTKQSTIRATLLEKINHFCTSHDVLRTHFGQLAVGDRDFVGDLERGASITLSRLERAEAFIDGYSPSNSDAIPSAANR